jgi:hypothetical protein
VRPAKPEIILEYFLYSSCAHELRKKANGRKRFAMPAHTESDFFLLIGKALQSAKDLRVASLPPPLSQTIPHDSDIPSWNFYPS